MGIKTLLTLAVAGGIFGTVLALRFVVWLAVQLTTPDFAARMRTSAARKAGLARAIFGDALTVFTAVVLRAALALGTARRRLGPVARSIGREVGAATRAGARGVRSSSGRLTRRARQRLPDVGRAALHGSRTAGGAVGRRLRQVPGGIRRTTAVAKPYVLAWLAAVELVVLAIARAVVQAVRGRAAQPSVDDVEAREPDRDDHDNRRHVSHTHTADTHGVSRV